MIDCQGFRQAEHDVHVLHGLSRRTLHKIIRYREYHGSIAPLGAVDCNAAEIRAAYRAGLRMSTCGKHVYKWLIGISFFVQGLQIGIFRKPDIECRVYASNHRREVWYERQPDWPPGGVR